LPSKVISTCVASFDHLVGKRKEIGWDSEPERLGGLEIDQKIEFGRLLYRQVALQLQQ
jgi:hypothetical protein